MMEYGPEFLKMLKAYSIRLCKPGNLISDACGRNAESDESIEKIADTKDAHRKNQIKKEQMR